ncbi:rod shape-determining protein MreC [Neptunomonas antarctica]|uniref:Cell shape-determining protein MreC n=1 Tax=Neptunomonas antarctica TaxID=619304 RepID=A0A1N7NWV7_9GAMM|nr:rod shape-determining protein MreC [Neptunomonas antarctica]SIT02766.1 rod shape-determining protein MreC [Neptunomonas antarctica]
MNPIFKGGIPRLFFFVLVILAIVFMVSDLNSPRTRDARNVLSLIMTPIQWLVDMPTRIADDLSDVLVSRRSLVKDNTQLRSEVILLDQKVQQMDSLTTENLRLRELLSGRERIRNNVQLAELIGVNPDPFQHQIILGKGLEDGVFMGQPVLDARGVLGQVVDVSHYTCRVMLITDARHALPVEINRNGFRAIALGKGSLEELELEYVPDTADIRVGDLLVSSGLGGRFPYGYPVATVSSVVRDPGRPFSRVKAVPAARLDKSRHLLLVEPVTENREESVNQQESSEVQMLNE